MNSIRNRPRNDSNHGLPAAYSQHRTHHRDERNKSPIIFRQGARYSSSQTRPYFRGGRPPLLSSRFNSRGRFFHVPYHSRPDISPERYSSRRPSSRHSVTKAERSPRSPRYRSRSKSIRKENKRSHSPSWQRGGRSGFRGSGRASRHSAIIGNFGCPIYHKPDYDISPDRTRRDAHIDSDELIEDRDEIFEKMMESKRSENLDQYYRYRDMLNEFDRLNPELAYRGGRIMKRRHSSSSDTNRGVVVDEQVIKRKKKAKKEYDKDSAKEELEEIDCSVHDEHEIGENLASNRKKHRTNKKDHSKEKSDEFNGEQKSDDQQIEKQPNDEELDYDDKMPEDYQNRQNDEDYYEYEEEFESEEINFDLVDNVVHNENEKMTQNQISDEYRQVKEKSVQTIPTRILMRDFLPLIQNSIANGLSTAVADMEKTRTISTTNKSSKNSGRKNKKSKKESKVPKNKEHEQRVQHGSEELNGTAKEGKPIQSLMELSLTKFVAETAFKLLNNTSLVKSNDDE